MSETEQPVEGVEDRPEDPAEDAFPPGQAPVGAEPSEEIPGGVQTTDPSFADGAQEVDSYSNKPREEAETE